MSLRDHLARRLDVPAEQCPGSGLPGNYRKVPTNGQPVDCCSVCAEWFSPVDGVVPNHDLCVRLDGDGKYKALNLTQWKENSPNWRDIVRERLEASNSASAE